MKESEKNISDTGLGMFSVLERASQEIERLKKVTLNPKSKYWKPINKRSTIVEASGAAGVKESPFGIMSSEVYDEWAKGYEYFCDQTVNTKGHKVNRRKLKAGILQKINYGKNDNKFD